MISLNLPKWLFSHLLLSPGKWLCCFQAGGSEALPRTVTPRGGQGVLMDSTMGGCLDLHLMWWWVPTLKLQG